MANFSTNEFKAGLKVMLDGEPCNILENEYVKPGKGQAFNRVKIRKLISGKVLEKTFRSGESVEGADVMDTELSYLYNDGEFWHFMNNESFEQFAADEKALGDVFGGLGHGTGYVHQAEHHGLGAGVGLLDQQVVLEVEGVEKRNAVNTCAQAFNFYFNFLYIAEVVRLFSLESRQLLLGFAQLGAAAAR